MVLDGSFGEMLVFVLRGDLELDFLPPLEEVEFVLRSLSSPAFSEPPGDLSFWAFYGDLEFF